MNKSKDNIVLWVIDSLIQFQRSYFISLILFSIWAGIIPPVLTIISQKIINSLQLKTEVRAVLPVIVIYIGLGLLQEVSRHMFNQYKYSFSKRYDAHINEKILLKAKSLRLSDYESSETYDIVERAKYSADGKLLSYIDLLVSIITMIVSCVSYLAIILSFNWLLLTAVVLIPICKYIVSDKINKEQYVLQKKRTNDERRCWYYQHIITSGDYYKELKVYRLFNLFINKFLNLRHQFNKQDIALCNKKTKLLIGMELLESVLEGLVFCYVFWCCHKDIIMIGDMIIYISAINQTKNLISTALQSVAEVKLQGLYILQLKEFLETIIEPDFGHVYPDEIYSIETRHLSFKYPNSPHYILYDVNLRLEKGRKTVIIGENGSGKTTLMKLIMGFYSDYDGEILINGLNLREYNKDALFKKIATLFQDYCKYEGTIRENIAFGNLSIISDDEEIKAICNKFKLEDIENDNLGLDTQIGYWFDEGKNLSMGQWQKIALCRAFIKNADIIIMDEPNAAIDVISERIINDLMNNAMDNKIGIIVAHRFNHIIQKADQIIVLKKGKISGCGTHDELINENLLYKTMCDLQM